MVLEMAAKNNYVYNYLSICIIYSPKGTLQFQFNLSEKDCRDRSGEDKGS